MENQNDDGVVSVGGGGRGEGWMVSYRITGKDPDE